MAITKDRITQPSPVVVPVSFDGEELTVTYNISACTPELLDTVGRAPARVILSQLLVAWEVLDEGRPYQPAPESDPIWAQRVEPIESLDGSIVRESIPVSAGERRAAYVAAWEAILRQLPQDFLGVVLGAILDDLSAGKPRRGASGAS